MFYAVVSRKSKNMYVQHKKSIRIFSNHVSSWLINLHSLITNSANKICAQYFIKSEIPEFFLNKLNFAAKGPLEITRNSNL